MNVRFCCITFDEIWDYFWRTFFLPYMQLMPTVMERSFSSFFKSEICFSEMSRFFQVSDSSSSDSESDQSDRENEQVQPTKRTAAKPQNKFKHGLMSDEEEEEKRIVKSAKEKRLVFSFKVYSYHFPSTILVPHLHKCFFFRYEELQALIKQLKNSKKINDFTNVFALFDDLTKVYDKSRTTLARFGEGVPPFYIKCIADLDDYIAVVRLKFQRFVSLS